MQYKKIAILGDLHLQEKEPFKSSAKKILDWILSNDTINNEDTLFIHLGDLFDTKENNGNLNEIVLRFYQSLKNKTKIQMVGNHDGDITGSALEAIKVVEGVELISEPTARVIEGKDFLFLPHIYTSSEGVTMEERYSNLHTTFVEPFDYCLGHILDHTQRFHKKAKICDLSKLNVKKFLHGHSHSPNLNDGGNYLGSLQPNSSTEKGEIKQVYVIDLEKNEDFTIDVPLFVNYYEVSYPNALPNIDVEYPILNIHESLDKKESMKYYVREAIEKGISNLAINRVFRRRLINDLDEIKSDTKNIKKDIDFYNIYSKEMNVSSGVDKIIRGVIESV